MEEKKRSHEELLNQIIEIELEMFKKVRTINPSLCQEQPEAFKVMRGMTHCVLSLETLESYLDDLQTAQKEGRNLLTEKYARIDDRIPPLKINPVISKIIEIEGNWLKEFSVKHPQIIKTELIGFERYLSSELETYSDRTLDLYFKDISRAKKEGKNLAEERYNKLAKKLGYDSLHDMEETIAKKSS